MVFDLRPRPVFNAPSVITQTVPYTYYQEVWNSLLTSNNALLSKINEADLRLACHARLVQHQIYAAFACTVGCGC